MKHINENVRIKKPKWLRRRLPTGPEYEKVRMLLKSNALTTVCTEAKCPNQFECYGKGTATFMILGERCTRNCRFCAVEHMPDSMPDPEEPSRVAEAVVLMKLRYAVITSVTRDDLEDGGASLFARTIVEIRKKSPKTLVEVLIPDLQGNWEALSEIVAARPNVLNHNIETVPRLYAEVRPQAEYSRSLRLLQKVKELDSQMVTKSGVMLGLGETHEELCEVWEDLFAVSCDILTMGQYLQPSADHLQVQRFIPPEEFASLEEESRGLGFSGVASDAFVRSSYQAEELYTKALHRLQSRQQKK